MNVRYKTLSAGPNGVIRAGTVLDVPDEQAKALLDGGYAETVGVKAAVAAAVHEVEKAVVPKQAVRKSTRATAKARGGKTGANQTAH